MFDSSIADSKLLNHIKRACIDATPKDTGNLAYNALHVFRTPRGIGVKYRNSVAGYGVILNDFRKLRGFAAGSLNRHYLWFDNGVHQNVTNTLIRRLTVNRPAKANKVIHPKDGTFTGRARRDIPNAPNDGSKIAQQLQNEHDQRQNFKDWFSRYTEFKNHNTKGWGI
jgi:hypothetical protein